MKEVMYKDEIELELKWAESNYAAIIQAMDRQGISDPNSKMALKKFRGLINQLQSNAPWLHIEAKRKIKILICDLHHRIDNYANLSEEERKYETLSVCPNGHCYKYTEDKCPFCLHSPVVDKIYSNAEVFKKTLYIGQLSNNYILTDDPNINNKIDKIEIGYNANYKCQGASISYKFWYRNNKNLDTYFYNNFQTENLSIKWEKLIQMCDKIVDGKQKEIEFTVPVND